MTCPDHRRLHTAVKLTIRAASLTRSTGPTHRHTTRSTSLRGPTANKTGTGVALVATLEKSTLILAWKSPRVKPTQRRLTTIRRRQTTTITSTQPSWLRSLLLRRSSRQHSKQDLDRRQHTLTSNRSENHSRRARLQVHSLGLHLLHTPDTHLLAQTWPVQRRRWITSRRGCSR